MVVDTRLPDAAPEITPPATAHATARPPDEGMAARLRSILILAGMVTLVGLTALATVHLVSDVSAVRGIRGGWSGFGLRLLPVAGMCLGGLGLILLVAWLAGAGRRRELVAIGIGFATLIGVRAFLSVQFDSGTAGEPGSYIRIGESLLTPAWDFMSRPMGYAFALAPGFALIDDRHMAAELVNLGFAVLAAGAVLGLARSLYGPRVGALALLGYAVWPAGALMTVVSIPETAFDLLTVAGAWAASGTRPGWRGDAVTGALVGLSQYFRPTAAVILPAYILARLWPGGSRRMLVRAIVVPVLAFLVVLIPVMLYNLERTGSPSFSTSDFGGQTFYLGTYEPSGGTFDRAANDALIALAGPDERARSALGTEIALQRIRDDPLGIAALAIRKQDTLWGTEHYGVQYAIGQRFRDRPEQRKVTAPLLLSQGFYVLLLASAAVGVWMRRRAIDALVPLVISMIWILSAMHALLEVRDRHHSYVIPLLLPLAALALARFYEGASGWLAQRRAAT